MKILLMPRCRVPLRIGPSIIEILNFRAKQIKFLIKVKNC